MLSSEEAREFFQNEGLFRCSLGKWEDPEHLLVDSMEKSKGWIVKAMLLLFRTSGWVLKNLTL